MLLSGNFFAQQFMPSDEELLDSLDSDHFFVIKVAVRLIRSDRILEWQADMKRTVLQGHPVTLRVTGHNLTLLTKVTPYPAGDKISLYFQGWIWLSREESVIHRVIHRTIEVLPDTTVTVFPLGEDPRPSLVDKLLRRSDPSDSDKHTVAISITTQVFAPE